MDRQQWLFDKSKIDGPWLNINKAQNGLIKGGNFADQCCHPVPTVVSYLVVVVRLCTDDPKNLKNLKGRS